MPEKKKPFCEPFNPTAEELSKWAYDPEGIEPVEDWDIIITDTARIPTFIRFASDHDCPKRLFFLSCLYLWIGDFVRSPQLESNRGEVMRILDRATQLPGRIVYDWAVASKELLAAPSSFRYDDWCAGVLAKKNLDQAMSQPE